MARSLLPVVVVPLLLAACSTSEDALRVEAASPAAVLQQAPDAAAAAGSSHLDLVITLALPGSATPAEVTGEGDVDTEEHVASMELDYGALLDQLGQALPGQVPEGLDEPMRFVVDDTTMYVDLPFLEALTGRGGWLSVPLEDAAGSAFEAFGAGADPGAVLDYLRGAGDVREGGREEVDGVATTRYSATIDLERALDRVPSAQRERIQAQIDQYGADVPDLPVTVWVDDDGLPRRMELALDLPNAGAMTVALTWSDYGVPVSVDVPDPDDVTPAEDVLGGLASSFLGER